MKRAALALLMAAAIFGEQYKAIGEPMGGTVAFPETTARQKVLKNGLTIIVDEDRSAPVASVQAWCKTGSIHEDKWLGAGLSHILEHMLFKGTEQRSTGQIAQKIQDEGGYINAYTSFDRTVYWIDIPSTGVPIALDILADAMMNSTLPPVEYTKEQEVIRREFAMGFDDPSRQSNYLLFGTAYRVHPYRNPVIGYIDVYNKLTRDDVMEYYKERYVPNNLAMIVVGDVKADEVFEQVEKLFEKYPRKALAPVYIPEEPIQLGRRQEHREFPTELARLHYAWHIPAVTHPDMPALDVLATVTGNGKSSRLYRKIREELKLAHSISAFSFTPAHPGLFGVEAVVDVEKRPALESEVMRILDEVKNDGVTKEELEKAKRMILGSQIESLTTMRGRAGDLGSNWLLTGNLDFTREYLTAIQHVTNEDLMRVARQYLIPRNLTASALEPAGAAAKSLIRPAQSEAPVVKKFELSNGLRLLVREDRRLPLVAITASFRGGLLSETPATSGLTSLLSRTIVKGTKRRTADEIASEIESVGGAIGSEAGNNSIGVSVSVMEPDLKLGLDLFADVLKNPTFPDLAVDREKEAQLAAIKREDEQITAVARNLAKQALFGNSPLAMRAAGTPETVKSLSREQLTRYHQEYITGANGVIAVFGNVNADDVRAEIEERLGDLPRGTVKLSNLSERPTLTESKDVEKTMDKSQAVLFVSYPGVSITDPDRYALAMIDTASSDLGSRFFTRIREEMGLAYFVGATELLALTPGAFFFYLGTDPKKVEDVRVAFLDEIGKVAKEGLTAEELARAKRKYLGQQQIQNQSNARFAQSCALDELYGLGFDHYLKEKQIIEALTIEDTRRVAARFFENKPRVIALVRPELKVETKKD